MVDNITPTGDVQNQTQPEPENNTSTLLTQPEEQPAQPETQDPAEKPADGGQDEKKDGDDKKSELPETYEIKLQDGFEMSADDQKEVDGLFKEIGLTAEQGQKLADFYMGRFKAQQDKVTADFQKQQEAEVAAVKADKEIGGSALNEQLGFARQAMDRFGGENFRRELESHGMGNNPEMIRLLARVGRAIQGDTLVVGANGGQSKDAAHTLYPNLA